MKRNLRHESDTEVSYVYHERMPIDEAADCRAGIDADKNRDGHLGREIITARHRLAISLLIARESIRPRHQSTRLK